MFVEIYWVPENSAGCQTNCKKRWIMQQETDTMHFGKGNHSDRKIGTMIARLSGVTEAEIDALGLWDPSIMKKFYLKLRSVLTISKLSGFSDPSCHWIARAEADPFAWSDNPQDSAMFTSFMPFLDSETTHEAVHAQLSIGQHTENEVVKALKFLRIVAWQDLAALYNMGLVDLSFFKSALIQKNWSTFQSWAAFVAEKEKVCVPSTEREPSLTEGFILSKLSDIEKQTSKNSIGIEELLKSNELHEQQGDNQVQNPSDWVQTMKSLNGADSIIL